MTQERVLLEVRELILADLNYGVSRVTDARDRLVYLDIDALLNQAEQRGEALGDFGLLEAEQTRKVDEEFREILKQTLGMSPTVCDQLLKRETMVDQSRTRTNPKSKPGE